MTLVVGARTFDAGPGELVWLPREVPHTFAEQAAYFSALAGAPDPQRVAEIGDQFGVRTLGPH